MASKSFLEELCEEMTCSICLECFKDPVTIDCGHNFCQACLSHFWGDSDQEASCPQCREAVQQKQLKPNRQLANVVKLAKKRKEQKNRESVETKEEVCEEHQESLSLFCRDDIASICKVCHQSEEHHHHNVVPIEKAVQDYQEKFKVLLELVKKERENLRNVKSSEDLRRQEYLKQFECEHQKAEFAFGRMQHFLKEVQQFWMANLEGMVKEVEKWSEENSSKLSEGVSRLSQLTSEIEERCEQPASKFLQNIRNALDRYQVNIEEYTQDISSKMEEKFKYVCLKIAVLEKTMEEYKVHVEKVLNPGILEKALDPDNLKQHTNKVCVTLDPNTAHPYLTLSENLKNVSWESNKKRREYLKKAKPTNPERFSWETCVLGSQKFTSGIHWWVVEILETGSWAIGVAKESVRRKGTVQLNPKEGVWCLRATYSPTEIVAVTLPEPTILVLSQELKKILVALDYDGARVDFFDGDTNAFIYSFLKASFSGEAIHPFFDVREWGFSLQCLS